jgi:DNA-binding response OmpR family regulator
MNTILVYSDDSRFGKSCASELKSEGYVPYVVSSEEGIVDFFKRRPAVDLVILNEGGEKSGSHHMLEVLRKLKPQVSVIMTADYFNFWNDFSTWLADACLVSSPDLTQLKDTVRLLLSQHGESQSQVGSAHFTVDWA